jgi:hypothetical protein
LYLRSQSLTQAVAEAQGQSEDAIIRRENQNVSR